MITTVIEREDGYTATSDEGLLYVPKDPSNRHYQEILEWIAEGKTPEPYVPEPEPIPTSVTMRQARLALLQFGLYQQVLDAIANLPEPQKTAAEIEWEYAGYVERTSAFTQSLALALGLTEQDLDSLFTLAGSL